MNTITLDQNLKASSTYEDQFLDLLEKHKRLIIKVASAYCRQTDERKDLIQDIILQLWKSYPKFDATYAASTWIYRIALNVSISNLRKETTRKKTYQGYGQEQAFLSWDESEIDERLEKLYQYINVLKPMNKAIMILHLEGLKNKEIAEVVGMTPTAISTRMQRIRETLKNQLANQ